MRNLKVLKVLVFTLLVTLVTTSPALSRQPDCVLTTSLKELSMHEGDHRVVSVTHNQKKTIGVTAAAAEAVSVSPTGAWIPAGETRNFTITCKDCRGGVEDRTGTVTFSAAGCTPAVVTVTCKQRRITAKPMSVDGIVRMKYRVAATISCIPPERVDITAIPPETDVFKVDPKERPARPTAFFTVECKAEGRGSFEFRSSAYLPATVPVSCTKKTEAVPTLTEWGLIALGLLLASSLAWMIRRRFSSRPAGA